MYSELHIEGRNHTLLINKLLKAGIKPLKLKIIDEKHIILRVRRKELQKAFAICSSLWYNKKVESGGVFAIFLPLRKHLLLALGIIAFFLAVVYLDGCVMRVDVSGADASEISELIEVEPLTRFSALNLREIEVKVLSSNTDFSFVTARKCGYSLIIDIFRKADEPKGIKKEKSIASSASGTIRSISVYRGTALKKVGEKVVVGEAVVSGEVDINGETFETGCLASFSVYCEFEYECCAESESQAVAIAEFHCPYEAVSRDYSVVNDENGIIYRVKIGYIVVCGG